MMNDGELPNTISKMIDEKFIAFGEQMDRKLEAFDKQMSEKFESSNRRLDFLTFKQKRIGKKLIDIDVDMQMTERNIRMDIHCTNDILETLIEMLRAQNPIRS